ncbi:MAG: hypothetical protein ACXW2P_04205, partial [Thermoanaerobaculia bacterium]
MALLIGAPRECAHHLPEASTLVDGSLAAVIGLAEYDGFQPGHMLGCEALDVADVLVFVHQVRCAAHEDPRPECRLRT